MNNQKKGDLTSDWMLHYRLLPSEVIIVQIAKHPFKFPEEQMMEEHKLSFKNFLEQSKDLKVRTS